MIVVTTADYGKRTLCGVLLARLVYRAGNRHLWVWILFMAGNQHLWIGTWITIPGCIVATPIEMPIDVVEGIPLEMPIMYLYMHSIPK